MSLRIKRFTKGTKIELRLKLAMLEVASEQIASLPPPPGSGLAEWLWSCCETANKGRPVST